MVEAISMHGSTLVTCDDLEGWVSKEIDQEITKFTHEIEAEMATGCSILLHEWLSESHQRFITFSVCCKGKSMVLDNFIDCEVKTGKCLVDLVKQVVEYVGLHNVIHVITGCHLFYRDAMKQVIEVIPSISWTPCVDQSMDFLFKELKKLNWIDCVFNKIKFISRFIYSHSSVLEFTKEKTGVTDLVILGPTNISTEFFTLKHFFTLKDSLMSTVETITWLDNLDCKTDEGLTTREYILDTSLWSNCASIVSFTDPFLSLIKFGQKDGQLGRTGAAIYIAKKAMKKVEDCSTLLDLISDAFPQVHLYGAALYMSPYFFRNANGSVRDQIRSFMFPCIEKYVSKPKQENAILHVLTYHKQEDDFETVLAKQSNLNAADWWSLFGANCPELCHLATRILTQPCSLGGSKPTKPCINSLDAENPELMRRLRYLRDTKRVFVREELSEMDRTQWVGEGHEHPTLMFDQDVGGTRDDVDEYCFDEEWLLKVK